MKDFYCLIYQVTPHQRHNVRSFIITDQPERIITIINHRDHYYRSRAFSSLYEAKNYLIGTMIPPNLKKFGLKDISEIELNKWYFQLSGNSNGTAQV